jgi:putative phosphoribosyl transferase
MPLVADATDIEIPVTGTFAVGPFIKGILTVPDNAKGIVIFAHGSGSGRNSPRNQYVAQVLKQSGFATGLFDLLTEQEAIEDEKTRRIRFDIELLSERLIIITDWILKNANTQNLNLGYYGASTGAAAAIIAASHFKELVRAVVSRGGRVDLASSSFKGLHEELSILLLVGSNDPQTISWNQKAMQQIKQVVNKRIVLIQGAGHLFEEEGKLEEVAKYASSWFESYL